MSSNIVFEGWLTKSPPSKRIWRTKWRRRWFALRQSCELPGQYFLDYYADRNCRRLKGTINLDLCEQVDAGLHMTRAGNGTLDPKLRGSVFTIQTQSRTYHLEADCEADMAQWVEAICKVCGLRPSEDEANETYQNTANVSRASNNQENVLTTGPYIPISECITGVRNQDQQRAFTFESGNVLSSTQKTMCDKSTETCGPRILIPPQIKITIVDSENESNLSDEDSKSPDASQATIPNWSVTKSFTKLAVNANKNEPNEDGPPVPPRPPKTFAKKKDVQKETFQGPKIQEPVVDSVKESIPSCTGPGSPWLRVPRRVTYSPIRQSSTRQKSRNHYTFRPADEDDINPGIKLPLSYIKKPVSRGYYTPSVPLYDIEPDEDDIFHPNIQHIFQRKNNPDNRGFRHSTYRRKHDREDSGFKQSTSKTRRDEDDPDVKQYRTRHNEDNPEKKPAYKIRREGNDPYNPGFRQPVNRTRHDGHSTFTPLPMYRREANDAYNPGIRCSLISQKQQTTYRTRHDEDEPELKQPMYKTWHEAVTPEHKHPTSRKNLDKDSPQTQYCNLPSLPPAVDRALKPRHSSHSIGHIHSYMVQPDAEIKAEQGVSDDKDDVKPETLQYLDLDLQSSATAFRNAGYPQRLDIIHGKSYSGVESECVYKTVDFLKTEAFNMTRQDAEAFRSHQY